MTNYERTVREQVIQGNTIHGIAKLTGVSWDKVYKDLKKYGIRTKRAHKPLREDKELIIELYKTLTAQEIADKWETSANAVRTQLSRWGVTKR